SQAIRQASRIPPRGNPYAAANFALRNALRRLRSAGPYRPRPRYVGYSPYASYRPRPRYVGYGPYPSYLSPEPCPPCPVCPTCAQAIHTPDTSQQPLPTAHTSPEAAGGGTASTSSAGGDARPSSEFQFEEEFGGGELPSGEFQEFGGVGETERGGEGEYYETE